MEKIEENNEQNVSIFSVFSFSFSDHYSSLHSDAIVAHVLFKTR